MASPPGRPAALPSTWAFRLLPARISARRSTCCALLRRNRLLSCATMDMGCSLPRIRSTIATMDQWVTTLNCNRATRVRIPTLDFSLLRSSSTQLAARSSQHVCTSASAHLARTTAILLARTRAIHAILRLFPSIPSRATAVSTARYSCVAAATLLRPISTLSRQFGRLGLVSNLALAPTVT
jgi:hypothetical protein